MQIKIYDLLKQGLEFKSDFNKFERVLKILDERTKDFYRKIDLVTDRSKRLFLCNRNADFNGRIAKMELKEIKIKNFQGAQYK